jgi:4-hydroxy-3-methylbut-2-enyl diphosphate reductase
VPPLIFRKGLDLKHAVAGALAESYGSDLVAFVKESGYRYASGRLTVHLAREFGFCYGVDRAVDYAYQARKRFPDRRVFLTGEIIHNPHVNTQLRDQGIRFLSDAGETLDHLQPDDVVILPAFGTTVELLEDLVGRGCTLVDTTCGSVLNVWKNVKRYAEDDFTSVIHGKYWHEETRATASQTLNAGGGAYLVVLDRDEADDVCTYIRHGGDRQAFLARFGPAVSPGFDPDVHLQRIGCANQTTMLSSESVAIGEMFRAAIRDRYGEAELPSRFRAFDTICSATQDRQDAVIALLAEQPIDLMVVIGGYNSSNTCNLARICAERRPTYHIADAAGLVSSDAIRHKPIGGKTELTTAGWLPPGPVSVGLTSGASTPDNIVESVIRRLEQLANG